jgi:SMODS and SLOG-associating 2TM effector domain family 5
MVTEKSDVEIKIDKLKSRIKHTSSVRFESARRVRTDYDVAQLTVIILSLWAILIAYIISKKLVPPTNHYIELFDAAGVILPVFIVVFSLVEGGQNYLRSYQLEMSARNLREMSDQLYTASAPAGLTQRNQIAIFNQFSQKYSDSLERSPVNHDNLDHFQQHYSNIRKDSDRWSKNWCEFTIYLFCVWLRAQFKRILYIFFWIAPFGLFQIAHLEFFPML